MPHRAIIFDLDGTLLDTLQDLCDATNRVLAARGFPPHPRDAYRYFVGDGPHMLVARALPEGARDEETVAEVVSAFRADYGENWAVRTRPYDGVPEMLDALTARGVPMAVLSNKPHENTQKCVGTLLRKWRFVSVIGQSDDIPPKPDPKGALYTAKVLAVPPSELLYVGDTNTDMQTARNTGMFAVGVLWGFRDREELETSGANVILAQPGELPGLFDGQPD